MVVERFEQNQIRNLEYLPLRKLPDLLLQVDITNESKMLLSAISDRQAV